MLKGGRGEDAAGDPPEVDPVAQSPAITLAILAVIALGFALQQSLVVPALPTIEEELGGTATSTTWLITGFLLSSAVATPIVGRFGDMYGRKRVMVLSLVGFAGSSVLAALAPGIGWLIVARILQGLAGGILPLAFGICRDELPVLRVAGGIGVISALLAAGAAMGIVLSGPIVTSLGTAWLFWLPLIALVPTIFAAWRYIPPSPPGTREPIDLLGGALLTGWLVCLLVAVSQSTSWGWSAPATLGLLVGAVVLFVAWVVAERRCEIPLIDVRLLGERTVFAVNAVSFTVGFTMQSLFTFVTRFVQIPESTGFGLGVPASQAGLVVLPWSAGAFLAGLASGRVAARFGSRQAMLIGAIVAVVPSWVLAWRSDSLVWICVAMGSTGVGTGLVTAAMPAILVAYARPEQTGVVTGMNQNIRTIGGAVGAQTLAAIISSTDAPALRPYTVSFLVVGGVALFGVVAAQLVPTERPHRPTTTRILRRRAVADATPGGATPAT